MRPYFMLVLLVVLVDLGTTHAGKQQSDTELCNAKGNKCVECIALDPCKYVIAKRLCVDKASGDYGTEESVISGQSCPTADADASSNSTTGSGNSTSTTPSNSTSTTPSNSTTSSPSLNTTTPAMTTSKSTNATTSKATTLAPNITTSVPTIKTSSATSKAPPPTPTPESGSRFDGWSFFGGILLTVGIASIAFVSLRYYRARTGQAAPNYNNF